MNVLISIIVPCYNQAHFLNESLDSVINQSYPNWECIIVNDGSPDNTEEIAKKWCKKDTRFKYLEKKNGGLSSARNAGIKISKGELILPLDADDIIDKNYLTQLVPVLNGDNSLAIASCYSKFFVGTKENIVYESKPIGSTIKNILFENSLIATSLFKKSCWNIVGGYDEQMKHGFEDWEFWVAITKLGYKYKIVEEFLFYYRRTKESMLSDTLKNHRIRNLEYVINKHKDFYKENNENTIKYLFFLIKLYRDSEERLKSSMEYKIGKLCLKPFRFFKVLKNKK
jgi:glycosyltransferase involved in cell wall biosynthesis